MAMIFLGAGLGVFIALQFCMPNNYLWPKASVCPVCGKTVWVWQAERHAYQLEIENRESLPAWLHVTIKASYIFHGSCAGTDPHEKVKVHWNRDGIGVEKELIRPKEAISVQFERKAVSRGAPPQKI
jgi:hypothetical protein